MEPSTKYLRIMFGDDDVPEIVIPLAPTSEPECYALALGNEQLITLPNGEVLDIYAEVSLVNAVADISLSIIEDERLFAIRCGSGVVFSYTTQSRLEILFQIGTGAWEE